MPPLLLRRHQDRLAGQPRPLRPHEGAEALPLHLQRPLPLLRHVQRLHRQPRQQGPPQGQAFQGKVFSLLSLGDLLFFFLVPIFQSCFQSTFTYACFRSVVVITCASHAQGRRFDPGREHISCNALRLGALEHHFHTQEGQPLQIIDFCLVW